MEKSYITYLREMIGDKMVVLNGAACVIVNDKNQILLQKRSDNHLWGLPGGLMELDETIEQCAIREVKEETNLDVKLTKFLGVFTNPMMRWGVSDKAKVIGFSFVAEVIGGSLAVNDDESLALQYFDLDDLPEIHAIDNFKTIEAYKNNTYHLIEGKQYNGNE